MARASLNHPAVKWTGGVLGALVVLGVLIALLFDWNELRGPLGRLVSVKAGRPVSITGDLEVHLWSMTPTATVNGLKIGNPAWVARKGTAAVEGDMADIERLTVRLSLLPLFKGDVVLPLVSIQKPTIRLARDDDGHGNWQADPEAAAKEGGGEPLDLPVVKQFIVANGHLDVSDAKRKLRFTGTLNADEKASGTAQAFRLEGNGRMNDEPFKVRVGGGPLLNVRKDEPYSFRAEVQAGGTRATASGVILKPFDLSGMEADLTLSGPDLADLYYITGLALPNTSRYGVKGKLRRNGAQLRFTQIDGRIGRSDLHGDLTVDTGGKRPKLTGDIHSRRLNLDDLAAPLGASPKGQAEDEGELGVAESGADAPVAAAVEADEPVTNTAEKASTSQDSRRAGESTPKAAFGGRVAATAKQGAPAESGGGAKKSAAAKPASGGKGAAAESSAVDPNTLLFPDAKLQVNRIRGMDAEVRYRAESIIARKVPLKKVTLNLILDNGVLTADPLAFELPQGQVVGTIRLDGRRDVQETIADIRMTGVELSQFKPKDSDVAPLTGVLQGRAQLTGQGSSVHDVASTANGTVSFVLPRGEVREAFAELTGINISRGVGLLITGDKNQTGLRCGVAEFKAKDGMLQAQTLVFDTDNVLITGEGKVNLETEQLDLTIAGHPKKLRLVRLRSPVEIGGPLRKPTIGIQTGKAITQAGLAAAAGTVFAPIAAALLFIDPGLAKDADCVALLTEAKANGAPVSAETLRTATGESRN